MKLLKYFITVIDRSRIGYMKITERTERYLIELNEDLLQ